MVEAQGDRGWGRGAGVRGYVVEGNRGSMVLPPPKPQNYQLSQQVLGRAGLTAFNAPRTRWQQGKLEGAVLTSGPQPL